MQKKDCGELADFIAANIMFDYEQKQRVLEELSPVKRLNKLVEILQREVQVLEIESQISEKAKEQIAEKFDDKLDDLLEEFNGNLQNVGKIYKSIARSFSKEDI